MYCEVCYAEMTRLHSIYGEQFRSCPICGNVIYVTELEEGPLEREFV